jgi:Tfp pilus assembly protein PilN
MINLLPYSEKQELINVEKQKTQNIILFLLNFFFFCLILWLFFLIFYFNIQIKTQRIYISGLEQCQESEEFKNKITTINKELLEINKVYNNKIYYSSVLNNILKIMPENSFLNSISFIDNKIQLSGFIATREDLLNLQGKLENDFKEVNFPPLNWIEKENINFFINFLYEKE